MNIKNLFTYEPKHSIDEIIRVTKDNPLSNRILIDYEIEKFGDSTIKEVIEKYSIKKIIHDNKSIEPINIIAASNHPNFCYIPMIDFLLNKKKVYRFEEHFSKHKIFDNNYFFLNINEIDSNEHMLYLKFNDRNGNKKYIIKHGHHRSVTAYFLQTIDNSYKLNGVKVIEYVINWDLMNTKNKYLKFINKKNYFDYEKFENYTR